jgi:hypothetical protein
MNEKLKGLFEKLEGRGQELSRREKRMEKKWLLAPNRRSKCVHTLPIHGGTIKTNRILSWNDIFGNQNQPPMSFEDN